MKYFTLVLFCFITTLSSHAQTAHAPTPHVVGAEDVLPHTLLVRVTPLAAADLRPAFQSIRPANDPDFRHTDIHLAKVADEAAIQTALGLPSALRHLELKPYIPTHSVAFEDIRERINPQLFSNSYSVAGPNSSTTLEALQQSKLAEDRLSRWFVLTYDSTIELSTALALVAKSSRIELAELKYLRHTCFVPNDSLLEQQYALGMMHAFEAWDVVRCDSTMVVADVDVGTEWDHPDLRNSIFYNKGEIGLDENGIDRRANGVDDDSDGFIDDWHGWDFDGPSGVAPDNDPTASTASHGTHTAGIIGATGNNHTGIAGVAFGCRLLPIKVSDEAGNSLNFGYEGIAYAADLHAKIVNCSWGGPTRAQAEQDVVDYAYYVKDCAVVAAAGNNGAYQDFYPGSYDHVLNVAALSPAGNVDYYSNYNTHVDVCAPGSSVVSTVTYDGYGPMSGTSMASPDAAGGLALVRQRFPDLNAGQAMEQLRVTSDRFDVDSSKIDLVGHGKVNLLRAVTETNTYSARIEDHRIVDDNGNGTFEPGESGGIIVYVRNYLKPLNDLNAKVEVVEGGDAVTLHTSVVQFGQAQTMQLVENIRVGFMLTVSDSVQPNTQVLVKLTFFDSTVGYSSDVDYLSFVINPAYLDLNQNNITATFSAKGSIGYNDVITNNEGSGFVWRNAPPNILPEGKSVLYSGGLMVGTDTDRVVDVVENDQFSGDNSDEDFTPFEMIRNVAPDNANALQELACAYSDSLASSSVPVGVRVWQKSYEFGSGPASNAVVVRYLLRRGLQDSSVTGPTDHTSAVLYMDWDIGLSGALNQTWLDSLTGTAITRRIEPGYPIVGERVISPIPAGASLQFHAIQNDGHVGDVNTYDGFSKLEKWRSMTEYFPQTGPSDVSSSYGLKDLPMASQDSIEMVVVLAVAEDEAGLNAAITDAANKYYAHAALSAPSQTLDGVEAYPMPFHEALHVRWNGAGDTPATVSLIDALGRTVLMKTVQGTSCDLVTASLPAGAYIVSIETAEGRSTRRVVAVQ